MASTQNDHAARASKPASTYGPPTRPRARPYHRMLEHLETKTNELLMSEYTKDVVKTLSSLEAASAVNPAMIDLQPEIQWYMRPYLLDFLIELHATFRLQPQTLFLSINILDRYCARRIVFKRHYQLVGCTALWIASKYEDKKSRVPTLRELSQMCRNAYGEEMFVQMEMHILSTLEWNIGHPTLEDCLQLTIRDSHFTALPPAHYKTLPVNPYSKSFPSTPRRIEKSPEEEAVLGVTAVARFLCELSLYNQYFMTVPASLVAITANLLACSMFHLPNATNALDNLIQKALNDQPQNRDCDMEGDENEQPEILGAFLSGLDQSALSTIGKTALMFVSQIPNITDILVKKHDKLGVIKVVKTFQSRNSSAFETVTYHAESIAEAQAEDITNDPQFLSVIYGLLKTQNLDLKKRVVSIPSLDVFGSPTFAKYGGFTSQHGCSPLTPPSASSQQSVFSVKPSDAGYVTPIHANSCMSSSSVSSVTGSAVQSKPRTFGAHHNNHQHRHNFHHTAASGESTFSPLSAGVNSSSIWSSPIANV